MAVQPRGAYAPGALPADRPSDDAHADAAAARWTADGANGQAPVHGVLRRCLARLHRSERGSQTVELALLLPVLALLMMAVLQAGLVASELVLAQAAARDAVRVAAVDDDAAAKAAAQAVAGDRAVVFDASPAAAARRAGDLVTVTLRLRSAVLDRIGVEAWFPAEATMRVEWP